MSYLSLEQLQSGLRASSSTEGIDNSQSRLSSVINSIKNRIFAFIDWIISHMREIKNSFLETLVDSLPSGRTFDRLVVFIKYNLR